ncbi:YybS family protein [Clostridium estertheticum]|uniref:YybS family protein n=1 Tax=Clostridium estertheticum TaxID=238834 RepID=UPI0013EEA826|nr:YybS family protein [Clostridium estertheticum]MBZ9609757.1 YybS family protein [Clostridium estertheticum]
MENKKYSTKAIVEASLIAVIISVIMIITGYLPIMSFIGILILPIPVAILYIRHNSKITITAIFLSIILTSLVYNPIMAIYSAIAYSIIGIALGYCVKENKRSSITLLFLGISSAISNILTIAFSMIFIEKVSFMNFISKNLEFFKQTMKVSFDGAKNFYSQAGITPEQLKLLNENFEMINKMDVTIVLVVIPASILIISFISAYLNYIVSRSILEKLNYKMDKVLPFSRVYVTNILGAVLIGIVCIGIILSAKKIAGGDYILNSSQLLVQLVFMINGLAAATYFLRVKKNLSKPVVALILVLTSFSRLGSIYFSIGLMEMAFDFRKLDPYRIKRK